MATRSLSCIIFILLLLIQNLYSQKTPEFYNIETYPSPKDTVIIYENELLKEMNFGWLEKFGYSIMQSGLGIIFGYAVGGKLAPNNYYALHYSFRGILISAYSFPILNYELLRISKRKKAMRRLIQKYDGNYINNKTQKSFNFSVKSGFNITKIEDKDIHYKSGYSFGLSKRWYLFNYLGFTGNIFYLHKKFLLSNKRIYSFWNNSINYSDINYDVKYIDISYIPILSIPIIQNINFNFAFGPSVSVPVYDKNNVQINKTVKIGSNNLKMDHHDFSFGEESVPLDPYFNFQTNVQINIFNFTLGFQYVKSLGKLRPFDLGGDEFYIQNFNLLVGYNIKL